MKFKIRTMNLNCRVVLFLVTIFFFSMILKSQTIEITSPKGGEELVGGTVKKIKWNSEDVAGNIDIAYSTDSINWVDITTDEENNGMLYWTVPNKNMDIVIKIQEAGGTLKDTIDAPISIILDQFTAKSYLPGIQVTGMATGDVEGNGSVELFIGEWSNYIVSVKTYDVMGDSMKIHSVTPAFNGNIHGVIVGDFDHDNDLDIIAGIRNRGVSICTWNETENNWNNPIDITEGHSYGHNVTGPFYINSDEHLDFIANQDQQQRIYYGNGDGTFSSDLNPLAADTADSAGSPSIPCAGMLYAADIDNDMDFDLVGLWRQGGWWYYSSNREDHFVRGFINLGDTSNPADGIIDWGVSLDTVIGHQTVDYDLNHMSNVAIGDYNEDGKIDMVVSDVTITNKRLMLFIGQGDESLTGWNESELTSDYEYAFSADINNDGHMDIICGNASSSEGMGIFYGNGDGTFELQEHDFSFGTTLKRKGGVAADFNNDGYIDIATKHYLSGMEDGFVVLMQQPKIVSTDLIYVDENATGNNTGLTWNDAFNDLQSVLDIAGPGTDIWVAQGIYKPTSDADRALSFVIPDSVSVYGGFNATELKLNERDFENNMTILSGDIGTEGDSTDNSYHVIRGGNYITLDGIIVERGMANGSNPHSFGGGMYNDNLTDIVIENCMFRNNIAQSQGGAIHNDNEVTNIQAKNCTFYKNMALESDGGAVKNENTEMHFYYCSFIENSDSSYASAIMYWGNSGSPIIENCTFYNNSSDSGAIHCRASGINATVRNCLFKHNDPNDVEVTNGAVANVYFSRTAQVDFMGVNSNISDDPMFVDSTGSKLSLLECSPCIDAGDTASVKDPDGTRANIGDRHEVIVDMPVIECVVDAVVDVDINNNIYTVQGSEFDPVNASDKCEFTISNDHNDSTTLEGETFNPGTYKITWTITDINNNVATCSFNLTVKSYVSVVGNTQIDFNIYPVPASDIINIKTNGLVFYMVSIVDITGKVMYESKINKSDVNIDISNLSKGVFFVKIISEDKSEIEKIIIK